MDTCRTSDLCRPAQELSVGDYYRWGAVLGKWVAPGAKFIVGGDTRESTPAYLDALVGGLCTSPIDCVHLACVPTPLIHYAKQRLHADGYAMVTASHQPSEVNGLQWMVGQRPPTLEDVQRLRSEAAEFDQQPRRPAVTKPRELDISFDYVAWLQETYVDALEAHLQVVLDPMHGCWAGLARRYLHAIFPGSLISVVRDKADGRFGGGTPDCSRDEKLAKLCDGVYRHRADLGIAFDGDGDRLALVDDESIPLSAEETTMVLLEALGSGLVAERFVYDLRFSDRVAEVAERLGAVPVPAAPASIRAQMVESGAVFGAGITGHYYFRELGGGDDALYTACWTIRYLARSGRRLSQLRRACPEAFVTPELRVPLPADGHAAVLDEIRGAWADYPQTGLDGVRITIPGGWALVRSPDDSALVFRFESVDWPGLEDLVQRFCQKAPKVGDRLWSTYRAAIQDGA